MRRIATVVAAVAVAGGLALGSAGVASASEDWVYQETFVSDDGVNVFIYSNSQGTRHVDSWYGLVWNGDIVYYIPQQ